MTHKVYTEEWHRTREPRLYLSRHGDVYPLPAERAELVQHLLYQRRIVSHLVDVLIYVREIGGVSR
jgi:hypothetical protein